MRSISLSVDELTQFLGAERLGGTAMRERGHDLRAEPEATRRIRFAWCVSPAIANSLACVGYLLIELTYEEFPSGYHTPATQLFGGYHRQWRELVAMTVARLDALDQEASEIVVVYGDEIPKLVQSGNTKTALASLFRKTAARVVQVAAPIESLCVRVATLRQLTEEVATFVARPLPSMPSSMPSWRWPTYARSNELLSEVTPRTLVALEHALESLEGLREALAEVVADLRALADDVVDADSSFMTRLEQAASRAIDSWGLARERFRNAASKAERLLAEVFPLPGKSASH